MVTTDQPWTKFPPKRENILDMLHAVQEKNADTTHIPMEDLSAVAQYVGIPVSELDGIVTFYQAFSRSRRGKHVIRMCDSLSCRVRGSLDLYYGIRDLLGISAGETTPDGQFTLEIVNCLGACDHAPNLMIDDELIEDADLEAIAGAIKALNPEVQR